MDPVDNAAAGGKAGDLDAILRTIREVEESLERRFARAEGVLTMVWGLVGAVIFGFYQLVDLNPAAYHALFGPLLGWVWLVPIGAGYVASTIVGARLGRVSATQRNELRRVWIPGAATSVVALFLVISGNTGLIYGAVTLSVGVMMIAFALGRPTRLAKLRLAHGAVLGVLGAVLLAWPFLYAGLLTALAFGVGFVALGTVKYRLGE